MDFDGARNAKAEVFAEAFKYEEIASARADEGGDPIFIPVPGTVAYEEIVSSRSQRKANPRDLIAVGVLNPGGHNSGSSNLKLGIFVQHNKLHQHPIVERAQQVAKGEARVIFTGPARRRAVVNGARYRPLQIGASVAHRRVTAGTLGCFCRHRSRGGLGILSNNHVLADNNRGLTGDIILQPSRLDGGKHTSQPDHVATLHSFAQLDFSPSGVNRVDCAFAYLVPEIEFEAASVSDPLDAGNVWKVGEIEDLLLAKDLVRKVGRTTGFTQGSVTAVSIDNLVVQMAFGAGAKLARFDGQIAIEGAGKPFSKGGDSGSLIFTEEGRPVALLFAGTDTRSRGSYGITYANPIELVLEQLDLEIYTGA